IPTLEEALSMDSETRYNLEIKPRDPEVAGRLWEYIAHHGVFDRVLVACEHDEVVNAFRGHSAGRVATSPGFREALRFWANVLCGTDRRSTFAFDALQIPPTFHGVRVVRPKFVEAAHRHGIQVHVWTINEPAEMRKLLSAGVDSIMTDVPDLLLEVLAGQ
ncbi:MAG: glycerophosphodiester phosphodiesterase family protein, partial [Myxococcota bacterium]